MYDYDLESMDTSRECHRVCVWHMFKIIFPCFDIAKNRKIIDICRITIYIVHVVSCNFKSLKYPWRIDYDIVVCEIGMVLNKGKIRGKMGFWEQTVPFLPTQITHTSFNRRIRLEPSRIFHQLNFTKQQEGLEDSMCITDLSSQSLILILMVILLCSLVIGSRSATR